MPIYKYIYIRKFPKRKNFLLTIYINIMIQKIVLYKNETFIIFISVGCAWDLPQLKLTTIKFLI